MNYTRHQLLWDLPLWILHDQIHAAYILKGIPTKWPEQATAEDASIQSTIAALTRR